MLESFDKEIRALKDDAVRISWYMRGGLQYDDAFLLGDKDKELIKKLIKENMETTNKTRLPFF